MARARLQLVRQDPPREARAEARSEPESEHVAEAPPSKRGRREALAALGDEELVALAAQELGKRGTTNAAALLPPEPSMGACEQLYRRHATFACNLAARISGSTHDVEDVVHDAFLRAFDHLPTLRNAGAFRVWLGSIVVHAMRSRLRRRRFLRFFGFAGERESGFDVDAIVSSEAPPSARAEIAQLYALLAAMPPDERIAWTLRFVEGHDLVETAEMCGCSLATVKRRIRRAQDAIDAKIVPLPPLEVDG